MKICVFGAASPTIDHAYVEAVENMGEYIARRGHELVFGAGANGLMGAAARGARRGGGRIFGAIPKFFEDDKIEEIFYDCDELVFTDTMHQRKALMEEKADAFIVVPGGIGTYEEMFEILTLKQLGRLNKNIVMLNFNGFYNDLLTALNHAISRDFITDKCRSLFRITDDYKKAVHLAEEAETERYNVSELKRG